MNVTASLPRLLAAVAVVGVAIVALWQAGVLFQPTTTTVTTDDGDVRVSAAVADLETPSVAGRSVGLEPGDIAPDFEFSTFTGDRVKLSDFRGQAVFLNFWASWCGPCRREMPNMMTMEEVYGPEGFLVIAVNNGEAIKPAQRFLTNVEVELGTVAYDPTSQIVQRYGVSGLPVSFFIDADGVITEVKIGEVRFEEMEAMVQNALKGFEALDQ